MGEEKEREQEGSPHLPPHTTTPATGPPASSGGGDPAARNTRIITTITNRNHILGKNFSTGANWSERRSLRMRQKATAIIWTSPPHKVHCIYIRTWGLSVAKH